MAVAEAEEVDADSAGRWMQVDGRRTSLAGADGRRTVDMTLANFILPLYFACKQGHSENVA